MKRGRDLKYNETMTRKNLYVPDSLYDFVKDYAKEKNTSVSALTVEYYLSLKNGDIKKDLPPYIIICKDSDEYKKVMKRIEPVLKK